MLAHFSTTYTEEPYAVLGIRNEMLDDGVKLVTVSETMPFNMRRGMWR